ncbi:type I-E CRISPR-associated protein Cas5/CasD [Tsukamurella sp. NPDC003166]|uniref:type I-E CRISPR-associated protein Cas5/CasD n=1 Tax=Tsukamurella sp. NPDC003166 TaxID=3154444 RepID=UPI00339DFDFB
MTALLIPLSAPMQSWGDSSRFVERKTRREPTKSGIIGLLGAAQGRRRTDPIEDLAALTFAVRTDQPGELQRDFQTAIDWRSGKAKPLSHRYYLADAKFLAAVEGPDDLLLGLQESLARPTFPLYLGRRSCPPSTPLRAHIREESAIECLKAEPWIATLTHRRKQATSVNLPITRDAMPGEPIDESIRDVPLSFDPTDRKYGWRDVVYDWAHFHNPESRRRTPDWLAPLGGS